MGQRYNSTAGLEKEFCDVVYKLFQFNDVNPQFERSLLRIKVRCYFPLTDSGRIIQVGDEIFKSFC